MSNPNEDRTVNTEQYNRRLMGNVVRLPLMVDSAHGSVIHVREPKTKILLDFWGDEGVCSLGYNTPEYREAVSRFAATGQPHQLPDVYPNEVRWDAAEIICDRTGMDRIFFCNSGTEANEAMIKLARKHWWDMEGGPMETQHRARPATRHTVLTVAGNFHGRTGLAMAASDPMVSPYHRWGFGPIARGFGVIDWEAGKGFRLVVTDGVEATGEEPNWNMVAGVLLAPVLGNNCVKTYPREFWDDLKSLRENHDVILMYDDVQAGSGRSGYHATWQSPDIRVKPDIMALGKGIALGHPMASMLASEAIARSFTPGVHFNTFGGSPFVCALAHYYFRWLDRNLPEVRRKGEGIREAFKGEDWIASYDGAGLLNAFAPDFERHHYDGFDFCHTARDYGLSLVTHRRFGPIRFTPPMNVSDGEIAIGINAIRQTHERLMGRYGK